MHENDPEIIEKEMQRKLDHKVDNLHEHAPGWNETLASESEANVKAEKHQGTPSTETTLEYIKKRHHTEETEVTKKGTGATTKRSFHTSARASQPGPGISDESDDGTEAKYDKEQVNGPLGEQGSKGKSEKAEKAAKAQSHPPNATSDAPTGSEDAVKAERGEA